MKEIKLTQGKFALVDEEDFEYLSNFKWHAVKSRNTFYAARKVTLNGKGIKHYMQWEILKSKSIDHIDNNGLNNTKDNLRLCTRSENMMNSIKQKNTSSIYKGVYFNKEHNRWRARIHINGNELNLGYFNLECDAAEAYNNKAIELFGNRANLNIIF